MTNETALLDMRALKKEFVNYASAILNSSDPKSRITETTTTFDGDDEKITSISIASNSPLINKLCANI